MSRTPIRPVKVTKKSTPKPAPIAPIPPKVLSDAIRDLIRKSYACLTWQQIETQLALASHQAKVDASGVKAAGP